MAEDFLTDHEQGENVKAWVRSNWLWVASGVAVGLGLLSGWQYYQRFVTNRAESAASMMDEYASVAAADKTKADALYQTLTEQYSATPYALQARLLKAQLAVEANDLATAETLLREVSKVSADPELKLVATLRLARVLIEQKKYDEALTMLDVTKLGTFAGQAHEVRGDAFVAKADIASARSEYHQALELQKQSDTDVSLLELKLQDLGDESAK